MDEDQEQVRRQKAIQLYQQGKKVSEMGPEILRTFNYRIPIDYGRKC
jgi:hypothetical protein